MEYDEPEEGPSKSARKRSAHAAQRLGMRLVELPDSELEALGLPERLVDALRDARRITSRAAAVRQRQFIGKLMRDLEPAEIEASLVERDRRRALQTARQRSIEEWRVRLLRDGARGLGALLEQYPRADRTELARLAAAASDLQIAESLRISAARELFRALRELLGRD